MASYKEYVMNELEELRWEHSWMESSYNKSNIEELGIPYVDNNYSGLAKYCRCYKCRPKLYEHLKGINIEIKNKLESNETSE